MFTIDLGRTQGKYHRSTRDVKVNGKKENQSYNNYYEIYIHSTVNTWQTSVTPKSLFVQHFYVGNSKTLYLVYTGM